MAKEKQRQKDRNAHKTKDRVTRTPLKTGGDLRCSVRVDSSCSTNVCLRMGTRSASPDSHLSNSTKFSLVD